MATVDLPGGNASVWCNFDGTSGSPSPLGGSHNVSSITDLGGTGGWRVNFSITFASTNYQVQVNCDDNGFSDIMVPVEDILAGGRSTTAAEVGTFGLFSSNFIDVPEVSMSVIGDLSASTAVDLPKGSAPIWCMQDASSGTPTIQESHNIFSITDNGSGDFTYNYAITMADTDYATALTIDDNGFQATISSQEGGGTARTTTSMRVFHFLLAGFGDGDREIISMAVYGDPASGTARDLPLEAAACWAHIDGNFPVTLNDSLNVASIIDGGTGIVSVNMSITMQGPTYAMLAKSDGNGFTYIPTSYECPSVSNGGPDRTTVGFSMCVKDTFAAPGTLIDVPSMNAVVYGAQA
jgi:hypothetical protein